MRLARKNSVPASVFCFRCVRGTIPPLHCHWGLWSGFSLRVTCAILGRVIAHEVSHQLHTAKTWVQSQIFSVEVCGTNGLSLTPLLSLIIRCPFHAVSYSGVLVTVSRSVRRRWPWEELTSRSHPGVVWNVFRSSLLDPWVTKSSQEMGRSKLTLAIAQY